MRNSGSIGFGFTKLAGQSQARQATLKTAARRQLAKNAHVPPIKRLPMVLILSGKLHGCDSPAHLKSTFSALKIERPPRRPSTTLTHSCFIWQKHTFAHWAHQGMAHEVGIFADHYHFVGKGVTGTNRVRAHQESTATRFTSSVEAR